MQEIQIQIRQIPMMYTGTNYPIEVPTTKWYQWCTNYPIVPMMYQLPDCTNEVPMVCKYLMVAMKYQPPNGSKGCMKMHLGTLQVQLLRAGKSLDWHSQVRLFSKLSTTPLSSKLSKLSTQSTLSAKVSKLSTTARCVCFKNYLQHCCHQSS